MIFVIVLLLAILLGLFGWVGTGLFHLLLWVALAIFIVNAFAYVMDRRR